MEQNRDSTEPPYLPIISESLREFIHCSPIKGRLWFSAEFLAEIVEALINLALTQVWKTNTAVTTTATTIATLMTTMTTTSTGAPWDAAEGTAGKKNCRMKLITQRLDGQRNKMSADLFVRGGHGSERRRRWIRYLGRYQRPCECCTSNPSSSKNVTETTLSMICLSTNTRYGCNRLDWNSPSSLPKDGQMKTCSSGVNRK